MDERPRPEDVTDVESDVILERALDLAEQRQLEERRRRVEAGIEDERGRLLRDTTKVTVPDDGGGW